MQNIIIQKAIHKDLNSILEITKDALNAMKAMNFHQWDENYPNEIVFQEDIQAQELYVFKENNEILGFICINEKFEPEFYKQVIFNKNYDDKAFYLHRLAVKQNAKGKGVAQKLLNFCENFALENHKASLRADTHSKNFPMNSLFKKLNFNFCGNFNIPNYQDPFLAYEKILNQKAF
ncbi:TPA: GNAT family N-acetyltransferase [Campylobacter jejuni]|nr:GNAT family N-acetyltransferase [Campylobacter jejuni]